MKLETVREIRNILLNERITYRGNEVPRLTQILAELNAEEAALTVQARVQTVPAALETPTSE